MATTYGDIKKAVDKTTVGVLTDKVQRSCAKTLWEKHKKGTLKNFPQEFEGLIKPHVSDTKLVSSLVKKFPGELQQAEKERSERKKGRYKDEAADMESHISLINEDYVDGKEAFDRVATAADKIKKLLRDYPVVQPQADTADTQLRDAKGLYKDLSDSKRQALTAKISGNSAAVEAEVVLADDLRKSIVDCAQEAESAYTVAEDAVEDEKYFEKVTDEIKVIQKDVGDLAETASEDVERAQTLHDETLEVNLRAARSARGKAEKALSDRKAAKTALLDNKAEIDDELTDTETAATSGDRVAANSAHENAKTIKTSANKNAGKIAAADLALKEAHDEATRIKKEQGNWYDHIFTEWYNQLTLLLGLTALALRVFPGNIREIFVIAAFLTLCVVMFSWRSKESRLKVGAISTKTYMGAVVLAWLWIHVFVPALSTEPVSDGNLLPGEPTATTAPAEEKVDCWLSENVGKPECQ